MFDYTPLWHTLERKGISTYKLVTYYGISKGTIDNLKHNRSVTIATVDKLCEILEVPISEIVNITTDK